MTRFANKITAAAVMSFIMVFGAATLVNAAVGKETSAPSADVQKSSDAPAGARLKEYAAEKLAGRELWVSAGSFLGAGIKGGIVNGVCISDDRLIDIEQTMREKPEKIAEAVNAFAEDYDGAVYFTVVPTSSGVYADTVPDQLISVSEKQQIDSIYGALDTGIRKIDAYNLMKMMSDEHIYFRSDNKWTMYGAYCVYRTVIQKLGIQPVSYDKYIIRHVSDEYYGGLYSRTLFMKCKPDILDIYEYPEGAKIMSCVGYDKDGKVKQCSLYNTDMIESDDMYRIYLGERMPLVRIRTDIRNGRRLLVMGDEFSYCFIPFLTQHYSEISVVSPRLLEGSVREQIDPDEYEQTLFLFGISELDGAALEKMK